ncbi:MAG: Rid family detoxifying hydrolase [Candidatus Eremiobacteraeota bacterium]|nr:Rid family detoxifying hydrolase [Candidatus Eremiobacteraeota bacterium]
MPAKTILQTEKAPGAIGPYSQGIRCGEFVFVSGQLPIDPETGEFVDGGIANKTKRAMDNVGAVLETEGLTYKNLMKVTIYTTQMDQFQEINEAYSWYFVGAPPARAVVGVSSLPKGASIEISAIAMC